jgi:PAZ domain.
MCNMILMLFFNYRFRLENNQSITVKDYFSSKKNVFLQYPKLPCLHVGSMSRETPIYLPSEVRKILFLIDCTVNDLHMTYKE